jgi:hypothetical protein
MRFRLLYRGPLAANGSLKQKQDLRRVFHPQLAELWKQSPLREHAQFLTPQGNSGALGPINIPYVRPYVVQAVGTFSFATVITSQLSLLAELDILLFRRQELGHLVQHGGDLDNRLKTLLDALRMPTVQELPAGDKPAASEEPFYCLLEDDALVSKVSVETERWLEDAPEGNVVLVISVLARPTVGTISNVGLLG